MDRHYARDDGLQAKIGELLMETELLYAKVEGDAMSGAQSISTGRVWERARC